MLMMNLKDLIYFYYIILYVNWYEKYTVFVEF